MRKVEVDSDGMKFYGDGENKATVNAPASLSTDTQIVLPSTSGTVALTSDITGGGSPTALVKATNQTVVSSTTLVDDDTLTFTAAAGVTYLIAFTGILVTVANDVKYGITAPADTVGVVTAQGSFGATLFSPTTFVGGVLQPVIGGDLASAAIYGIMLSAHGTIKSASGGAVKIRFAQFVSSGTPNGLAAGSTLVYQACS